MHSLSSYLLLPIFLKLASSADKTPIVERHLQITPDYHVSWVAYGRGSNDEILFNVSARIRQDQYVGFGLSPTGAMNKADIVIAQVQRDGRITIEDRHGIGNMEPVLDSSQDWKLLHTFRNWTHTFFQISRLLDTGDPDDLEITEDLIRIIWAYGESGHHPDGGISYHGPNNNRGIATVSMLTEASKILTAQDLEKKYKVWNLHKKVRVAGNDTGYMCSWHKGPQLNKKNHVIGYSWYISPPWHNKRLHHANLYRCSAPVGVDPDEYFAPFLGDGYECHHSPVWIPYDDCLQFEFQWTQGDEITLFPDNLGLPLGRSDGRIEYFMTEVRFDNPEKRTDLEITSGFNVYYAPELRESEIGLLQLGVMTNQTYALTIPPNSVDFVVSSHCPMDCTKNIPEHGINLFTYMFHSHLSGRKHRLRQFREGKELDLIAKDEDFDFHYQTNRRLRNPVKVLPGDHLTIECTYDTTWRKGLSVLGGRAPGEETCQIFILYYPRIENVVQCGSYHKPKEILNYMGIEDAFQHQGEIDATITLPPSLSGLKYSYVVEQLTNWTPAKRKEYQDMVRYKEQQAYCVPIEYFNETFVTTKYPDVPTNLDPFFPFPSPFSSFFSQINVSTDQLVIISAVIIVILGCVISICYVVQRMKKRTQNASYIEGGLSGIESTKNTLQIPTFSITETKRNSLLN